MPAAFVQASTPKTAANTTTITSNSLTTTAGNSLFAVLSLGGGSSGSVTPATPTDSKGNTWAKDVVGQSSTLTCVINSCVAPGTMGTSHTVTQTWTATPGADAGMGFLEYSGIANAAVLATNSNSGSSTTPSTGAANAGGTNSIFIIVENNSGSVSIAADSPWNERSETESGTNAQPYNVADQLNVTGSKTGSWVIGSSGNWVAAIAAYQASASTTDVLSNNPEPKMSTYRPAPFRPGFGR